MINRGSRGIRENRGKRDNLPLFTQFSPLAKQAFPNYVIAIISVIFSLSLSAQDVAVEVQYPSVVNSGQQFSITWTVNAGGGEFTPPSFTPFAVLAGPMTAYSSSMQVINGRRTQSISNTYTYYLQAMRDGKFVIPPAVFSLQNRRYTSDSLHIEVIGGNSAQPSSSAGSSANQQAEPDGRDFFISLTLNKREAYIGEPVTATVKIFTRVNIAGIDDVRFPQFDGFLKTDIDTPPITSLNQENIGGTIYGTGILHQFLLYPQKTGEIVIDPVQLKFLIRERTGRSDSFFGDFFATYQNVPKAVESQSVRLKVNPLPGSQPSDYSGVVGKLDINSSVNKDTLDVNDAINFKITISGSGNLKIASAPALNLSPDIEIYDPKTTDDIKNGAGSRSFEYLLIPRHYGDYTIPPVTYSYFNASNGRFEQLRTPEYRFYVRRGADTNSDLTIFGGVSKEDVRYVGRDIRFIKSDAGKLTKTKTGLISNRTYQSLYVLAVLAFFVVLFIRREHVKRNSDISKVRNRRAGKVAVKRLKNADVCLKNNQLDKFYEETLKALWDYFSDKLNIPKADLTKAKIASALSDKKVDEALIEQLNETLDKCEYARFAPSSSETEAAAIYEKASQIIKSVENAIV